MSSSSARDVEIRLVVTRTSGETELATVGDGPMTIGRGSDCAIIVDENRVSRNHCVVFPLAGSLHVKDLGSANGTFVNGESVSHRKLVHGDTIEVGGARIRVQVVDLVRAKPSDDTASLASPRLSLVESLGVLLQGSRDLSASAKAAVGLLQELIPAERSFVLLASERNRGKLPVLATAQSSDARGNAPPPSAALAIEVLETGKPYYTSNGSYHARVGAEIRNRAVMCAPLEANGERLGVLYSDSAADDLLPDEELESIFEGIAAQTALTLAGAAEHIQQAVGPARPSNVPDPVETAMMRRTGYDLPSVRELLEASEKQREANGLDRQSETARQLAAGLVRDANRLTETLGSLIDTISRPASDVATKAMARRAAQRFTTRLAEMAEAYHLAMTTEAGAVELNSEDVDVGGLLTSVAKGVRDEAGIGQVTLELSGVDLTASAFVDRLAISRVLDTLTSLAVYLASPGGEVKLSCRHEGGIVTVTVEETGGDQRTDERFRLIIAWSNKAVPEAHDLGALLTSARLAVEAHGGRLRLSGDRSFTRWVVTMPSSGDSDMEATEVINASPELLALRERLNQRYK